MLKIILHNRVANQVLRNAVGVGGGVRFPGKNVTKVRYVTISRAHSAAVSVITRFAGWSYCGRARRSPALECVLKAFVFKIRCSTHTDDVVQSFINSLVHKFLFCCH